MRFVALAIVASLLGQIVAVADEPTYGVSGNPGAVNVLIGTGELGRKVFHIPQSSGVRLAGLWMGDGNPVLNGVSGTRFTGNSLLLLDFSINFEKAIGWKGAMFGTEFLQFDGQATNADAGVAQGFNSITGDPPLNRSQLYQLWIRQTFCDDKVSIRIGKTVPIYHFNNVSNPVPTDSPSESIPSVSALVYTPLYVNTTLLSAIGGYYNSVYGITVTIAPVKQAYLNLGMFDGNLARGVQTGLTGPHFNGYYFSIGEVGYGWDKKLPGLVAVGGWYQSGHLKLGEITQHGTGGVYAFGSQAVWIRHAQDNKPHGNLSMFWQWGWNQAKTLPMDLFFGAGLTGFALIPGRPGDSFGMGVAWSRLNQRLFARHTELMLQGYYQLQIREWVYFQPVLSYIPNPGRTLIESNVCAFTARLMILF